MKNEEISIFLHCLTESSMLVALTENILKFFKLLFGSLTPKHVFDDIWDVFKISWLKL